MRHSPLLLALLLALTPAAGPACAQAQNAPAAPRPLVPEDPIPPADTHPVPPPVLATPPAPIPNATVGKPDVTLLNKAIGAIEQGKALESRSEMQMTAVSQGMTVVFRERVHFLLQKPGKYHSEIALLQPDGTPGAKYTVVSNGTRVWVYQPGANQYAVLSRAAFEANDLAGLGLYGSLVSDSVGDTGGGLLDLTSLTKSGVKLQGGTQALDGTDYQVFSMTDPKQGYKFRFLLDPEAAVIHELDLKGQQKALTFTLTETIDMQTSSPTLAPSLFVFTPPPGAKRVPTLPIGPF